MSLLELHAKDRSKLPVCNLSKIFFIAIISPEFKDTEPNLK